MPGNANSLRAGGAFVEIGADDAALRATLALVKGRLKAFQASVNKIGKVGGGLTGGLTSGISAVTTGVAQMTRAVTSSFAGVAGNIRQISTDFSQLGFIAGGAGIAIGFGLKDAIKGYADLDTSIRAAVAISRGGADAFDLLKTKARQLGATTTFTSNEVAEAMVTLARAGQTAEEQLDTISVVLDTARGTMTSMADSAMILVNTMRQFGLATDQARRVADTLVTAANSSTQTLLDLGDSMKFLGPVAAGLGVSLEETATALALIANAGIRGTLAGTQMGRVLKELSKSAKQLKLKEALDLDIRDGQTNALSLKKLFTQLEERTKGLSNLDKLGIFEEVFGRGNVVAQVLSKSVGSFEELYQKILKSRLESSKLRKAMEAGVGGAILLATSAATELKNEIAEAILPAVTSVLHVVTDLTRSTIDWVKANGKLVNQFVKIAAAMSVLGVGTLVAGISFKALQLAASTFFSVFQIAIAPAILAVKLLSAALRAAAQVALSAIQVAVQGVAASMSVMLSIMQSAAGAVATAFSIAPLLGIALVIGTIGVAFVGLLEALRKGREAFGALSKVAESFGLAFSAIGNATTQLVKDVFSKFTSLFSGLIGIAQTTGMAIGDSLMVGDIGGAFEVGLKGAKAAWDAFMLNLSLSGLILDAQDTWVAIRTSLNSALNDMRFAFSDWFGWIGDWFSILSAGFGEFARQSMIVADAFERGRAADLARSGGGAAEGKQKSQAQVDFELREIANRRAYEADNKRHRREAFARTEARAAAADASKKELASVAKVAAAKADAAKLKAKIDADAQRDLARKEYDSLIAGLKASEDSLNAQVTGKTLGTGENDNAGGSGFSPVGSFGGQFSKQLGFAEREHTTGHERRLETLIERILEEQRRGKPLTAVSK